MSPRKHLLSPALLVAALGYFVDVYDLILFLVVKNPSLAALGVPRDEFVAIGHRLLDYQMVGMLLGGLAWGVLGDRVGRTRVLFGSIIIYSLANIANAFVTGLPAYAAFRFIAGFGLAGELGAGVTLVAELLPKHLRGYGTTVIACVGVLGAVFAGLTGEILPWRVSYILGGVLGLALLTVRISVQDPKIYEATKSSHAKRGSLVMLVSSPRRLGRYLSYIILGLPIWYSIGILLSNATEIAAAINVQGIPKQGLCIAWCYSGLCVGDATAGILSQITQSRKRSLAAFLFLSLVSPTLLLLSTGISLFTFYAYYSLVGFSVGYWILLLTSATERFGTNLRATVTTSIPNFIRAAIVPISSLFLMLKGTYGLTGAALLVGIATCALASTSLFLIKESFHADLDFVEE